MSSIGLVMEDLIILQKRLTDSEYIRINGIQDDVIRVKKVAELLNNRRALPPRYKVLIGKWRGFEGINVKEDILF